VEFARVLDVLDKLSTSLRGDGRGGGPIAGVVDASAEIADGNGQAMKDALGELSDALRMSSTRGEVTRDQLTDILRNVSTLFEAAADNDATLREFGSNVRQLSQVLADENFGSGTTGRKINDVVKQLGEVLDTHRDAVKQIVANADTALTTTVDHRRDLAEVLDLAPMTLDNLYNAIDRTNGSVRVHVLTDKVLFDTQTVKEMCNMMGLRQLGCSTGTLEDFGPDFGLSYVLDGLAAMGQK
jgi:ABC-type transporter Mla subunit MlaD